MNETVVKQKINKSINNNHKTMVGQKSNDECYTPYDCIFNELYNWGKLGKFVGKNIICPCDWEVDDKIKSITIDCESMIVTSNAIQEKGLFITQKLCDEVSYDYITKTIQNSKKCNFIKVLIDNFRCWGIKSITASGYNPFNNVGIRFQDIDYSKYDICITNPPFSLYNDFMKCVVDNIDFICLSPFLNRVTPNIGLPLMLKKAFIGFSGNANSSGYLQIKFVNVINEYNTTKNVACDWITSFNDAQLIRDRIIQYNDNIKYNTYKDLYPIMNEMTMKDGSHPIRVPVDAFPYDYEGWMFSAINILTKIDSKHYEWYGTNFKMFYNKINPQKNPFSHKVTDKMVNIDGKQLFHGIVFRKVIKNS